MHALGRPYVCMALAALTVIAADRALTGVPLTNARLGFAGIVGGAIGLVCLRLVQQLRYSHRCAARLSGRLRNQRCKGSE